MTEVQRRRADQQVFEGDLETLPFLLSFDASRKSRNVKRHRVHWHVAGQPLDELQSPLLPHRRVRPIGTMNQFGDCHDRHTDFGIALARPNALEDLQDCLASTFGGDDDAGVENYSGHAGGFHGFRFSRMSSTSSAKSASKTGALPVSFSCAFAVSGRATAQDGCRAAASRRRDTDRLTDLLERLRPDDPGRPE
jgi:hypothetical protein